MVTDLSQYRELYLETARKLLSEMKKSKMEFESNSSPTTALDELHRNAHSLKSQSLVMGYPKLGLLNKSLEAVFLGLKEKNIQYNSQIEGIIERALTSIAFSLDHIEKTNDEGDISHQIEEMSQISGL
jgi:chemotaxis protein histidine kinase CheA